MSMSNDAPSESAEQRPFRIGMVLTHCHPDVAGGAEWQARLLARTLALRGHEVVLFALNPLNARPSRETIDGFTIVRVPPLVVRGVSRGGGIGSPILIWRLASAILTENRGFDVLHSHLAGVSTAAAVVAARVRKMPVIVKLACSGAVGDIEKLRSIGLARHGPLIRRLVSRADRVVAMTEELAREAEAFGFRPEQIVRIPNGVELPAIPPLSEEGIPFPSAPLAGRSGAAAASVPNPGSRASATIVAVSRLVPQKRLDLLVTAVAKLRGQFPGIRALIFGEGSERNELTRLIGSSGAGGAVQLMGRQPPERIYPQTGIFVLPSDHEGMSNALLEAMSWAKPCVVSDIPPNCETAADGAVYFPRGDGEGLAAAVSRLIASADEGRELGKRARERAERAFSIGTIATRYEALYASVRQ